MGNSIEAQPGAQLGGLLGVYFVEHRRVTRWPVATAGRLLAGHGLAAGAQFAQLVGTIYTEALSTDATDTQHGAQFAQLLEGFYAGDDPDVGSQFERMNGRRYLVLARYFDGRVVAVGNQLAGLLFTSKYATGTRPRERKGYAFKFEAATSTAAAYLTQPFDVAGVGSITPGDTGEPGAPTGNEGDPNGVQIFKKGQLVATLYPGDRLTITSPFRVSLKVT